MEKAVIVTINPNELIGSPLDWAVAKLAGIPVSIRRGGMISDGEAVIMTDCGTSVWSPSVNWAQGGPLIERFSVCVDYLGFGTFDAYIRVCGKNRRHRSKSILLSSMRAIVRANFCQDEFDPESMVSFEIPESLMSPK